MRVKEYYQLTKPGIVRGNAITLLAGYGLAASLYGFDVVVMFAVLVGTSLTIASGCVYNNYLDRGIDEKMDRTRKRALVTGAISGRSALWFASLLGVLGLSTLYLWVNWLVALLGLIALLWYVVIYGIAKRATPWSTLVGSVAGAIPPMAGYVAARGQIDAAAVILFAILTVWQMPHFYAIAIRRADEYAAGGLPVLPLVRGVWATRKRMIAWMIAFIVVTPLLTIFGYTGRVYLTLSVALGVYWLATALRTWHEPSEKKWAGRIFGVSLLVLLIQSVLIATGHLLP